MKEKILITLAAIMTAISFILALGVGILYFTQVYGSNKTLAVAAVAEKESVKQPGTLKGKIDNTQTTKENITETGSNQNPDSIKKGDINPEVLKITAVGDILLGRSVKNRVEKRTTRYLYPFEKTADLLKNGDIIFANLEESITSSQKGLVGIKDGGKYVLKNEVEAIEGLKYAGFNLFSLANNHILDYYEKGLLDTMEILDRNGIVHAGAGRNIEEARKLKIIEKKGVKIGILAYTDMAEVTYKGNPPLSFLATKDKSGVAPTKMDYIREDIAKARGMVDILMVSLHWGIEYTYEPTAKQIDMAHEIIDLGADMLIGHHTHRFQSIEIYKDKPIFYSLGNFIFDQNDPENQQGFIINMEYSNKKLSKLNGIPFKIIDKSQVVPQSGKDAETMVSREIELCRKLNTPSRLEDNRIVFDLK